MDNDNDDNGFVFEFDDDSFEMEDLFGSSEFQAPLKDEPKRHKKKLPVEIPTALDMDGVPDMNELLYRQALEGEELKAITPTEDDIAKGMPTDIFQTVDAQNMDELIYGKTDTSMVTVEGEVVEITIPGAIIELVGGAQGRVDKDEFADWSMVHPGDSVIAEHSAEDPGPFYNLRLIKYFPRERDRSHSKGNRKAVAGIMIKPGDGFVLDASNICRSYLDLDGASSLSPLLSLVVLIYESGGYCQCVFDANERYVLRRNRAATDSERVYEQLLTRYSTIFIEAPGATDADEYLLKIANRDRLPVISNDRFDKPGDEYRRQYSWLVPGSNRLLAGSVDNGLLHIDKLHLSTTVDHDLKALVRRLDSLI